VIDVHADPDHHRSVVTMASADLTELLDDLWAAVSLAVRRIDLRAHRGLHPRVGAADVVPLVPLGKARTEEVVEAARGFGERLWRELGLPVYFYGQAAGGRRLADVRAGRVPLDLGERPDPRIGAACVGTRPPLVAYNLLFPELDLEAVRGMARQMRRLPGVQALAFSLPAGPQLSMNLTRLEAVAVPEAYAEAARLAGVPGRPELVGLCPAAAAGPGCEGGLLEARLAAAAARRAAAVARSRDNPELSLLARRLEAEASSIAGLGIDATALLGGAERAAALLRVLAAAGIGSPATDALLRVAARGLRDAVREPPATAARRLELLDRWLGSD
jgi:glutamate formiminotransferase